MLRLSFPVDLYFNSYPAKRDFITGNRSGIPNIPGYLNHFP